MGRNIVTSHRGFNQCGSDVKMWDRRNLQQPLYTYSGHEMSPITRFLQSTKGKIAVSVGQDSHLALLDSQSKEPILTDRTVSGMVCLDNLPENNGQTPAWKDSLNILVMADLN